MEGWRLALSNRTGSARQLERHPVPQQQRHRQARQIPADGRGNGTDNRADRDLRTPLALNSFVNGRTVSITRDNKEDVAHFGKEVSLYIYDRKEIAGGKSTYQIVQQPVYPAKNTMLSSRRGDLVLLINGMPLIHIELKKSGIPVSQATNQIEKYTHEGVFTGLFRLVQIL